VEPRPERVFDYREFPVLYVDDEPENLRVFELTFRREFTILTATSGPQGLEVLNTQPVALVLSDHRMPGMSGVEFLARAREIDPKALRVLVTAYGDAETLGRAINDGSIYRFVPKPWDAEDLRINLRHAIEAYALDRERQALVRELATVNQIAATINRELSLERLHDLLVDALTRDLGYDAASLLLLDPAGRTLRFERLRPGDEAVGEALSHLEISAEQAPHFLTALAEGECRRLSLDAMASYEPPLRRWLTEVAADQILVVPLTGVQGLMGALAVDNRRGSGRLGVEDRTLVEGIATQAAISIQNARLVEDLRHSQRQVLHAERRGSLAVLAAGLARQIHEPLCSIQRFLRQAPSRRQEDDGPFWGAAHRGVCEELERIRELVATLSELGHPDARISPRTPCVLPPLVEELAIRAAREVQGLGVRVEVETGSGSPKVLVVRSQIEQLLATLLRHAVQASAPAGRVEIRVGSGDPDGAWVEVTDQGAGLGEDALEQLFEPLHRRKGSGGSDDLELLLCQHIAEAHGGRIEVESRPGQGTTFRLWLPPPRSRGPRR